MTLSSLSLLLLTILVGAWCLRTIIRAKIAIEEEYWITRANRRFEHRQARLRAIQNPKSKIQN